jgi:hypothetical protein
LYIQQQQPIQQEYNPFFSAQQLAPVTQVRPQQARLSGGRQLGGSECQYPVADQSQCDKYYACNADGVQEEKLCLDGLVFNPLLARRRKNDPCDYPQEVDCGSRTQLR